LQNEVFAAVSFFASFAIIQARTDSCYQLRRHVCKSGTIKAGLSDFLEAPFFVREKVGK
jgi:hypothetical protein